MVDRVSPAQLGDILALALRKRWVLAATAEASLEETLATIAGRAGELPLYGLRLVVHQRFVPLLCSGCRVECVLGTAEKQAVAKFLPETKAVFQEGDGCPRCAGRGVSGARVFFEVLPVDAAVREALYSESRGEPRLESLAQRVRPSIRTQVGAAVARGEVSLAELWDVI
jgi:type II secretory ATPase GspE/PulE/Tfp pilus assembly ATPase PilB-like protein